MRNYFNYPELIDEIFIMENVVDSHMANLIHYICGCLCKYNVGEGYLFEGTCHINTEKTKYKPKNIKEAIQFSTSIVKEVNGKTMMIPSENQRHGIYYLLPLYMGLSRLGLKVDFEDIIRSKINFQTSKSQITDKNHYCFPHVDVDQDRNDLKKSYTAIYYANTCDGDTIIFKDKDGDFPPEKTYIDGSISDEYMEYLDNLNIDKKITPKKGTLLIFRSDRIHTGSFPIVSQDRIVINYNFIPTPSFMEVMKDGGVDIISKKIN